MPVKLGTKNMKTLGDELQNEITRVRDHILSVYDSLGPSGVVAASMMRTSLDNAVKTIMEGDLPGMIIAYEDLKRYSL